MRSGLQILKFFAFIFRSVFSYLGSYDCVRLQDDIIQCSYDRYNFRQI